MGPPQHRNGNSNPVRKLFLTTQAVNPRFPLHVPIFEEESIPDRLTFRYFEVRYAFDVNGFCPLFSAQRLRFCPD